MIVAEDSDRTKSTVPLAGHSTGVELAISRLLYPLASLILVFPLFFLIYRPAADGLDVTGYQIGRDFIYVWATPQLAFNNQLGTLFDLQGYHAAIGVLFGRPLPFHNWSYPLFTLPAFWPLAQLPYFVALAIWTFGLGTIFAAITLSQIGRPNRVYVLFALLFAPACLINLVSGQNGFLSATLLLGGVLCLDRRPIVSGVLFGLLAFKPHLGLVLPFALLALGAWRTITVAALTVAALLAGSVALFGIESWQRYFEVSGAHQVLLLEKFQGFYTIMMASVFAGARASGLSYNTAMTIQIAVAIPVLASACVAVRRTSDPCCRAFVLSSASPLLTPYVFNYDLTALAAVLIWILGGRLSWCHKWRSVYFFAYIAPVAVMSLQILNLGFALAMPVVPLVMPLVPLVLMTVFLMSLHEVHQGSFPRIGPLEASAPGSKFN